MKDHEIVYVVEICVPQGRLKADDNKFSVTFESEEEARNALKLYRVQTHSVSLELRPVVVSR